MELKIDSKDSRFAVASSTVSKKGVVAQL